MKIAFIRKLNTSLKYQKKPAAEYSSISSTHRDYRPILPHQTTLRLLTKFQVT